MSWLAPYAYWAAICSVLGCALYSEMLDRSASDDALGDAAHGDWPFVPTDDLKLFHASQLSGGAQQDAA
jgi:hypothetical protein